MESLLQKFQEIFGITDGTDVAPTALIVCICGAITLAVLILVIILARKNRKKKD